MFFKKKSAPSSPSRHSLNGARTNAPVFSYHASRSVRPEAARRDASWGKEAPKSTSAAVLRGKRINWLKRGPVLAGSAVLLFVVLGNMVVSANPKIVVADDPSQSGQIFLRSPAVYIRAAHDILASSLLNRNKITIDTGAITSRMRSQFPELASVSIGLPFIGSQPVMYVQPAVPKLLLTDTSGTMYVLDSSGRALIVASQVPHLDKLGLPMVTDQSGLAVDLGKTTLPSNSVAFITEVVGQLKSKGVTIKSLTLPKASSELDVMVSGASYIVKYNLHSDGRAEAGTYLAAIAQLNREHKTPTSYIDVRVDQRAYYK